MSDGVSLALPAPYQLGADNAAAAICRVDRDRFHHVPMRAPLAQRFRMDRFAKSKVPGQSSMSKIEG